MKKRPHWHIFKPAWGQGMWVAWHPYQGSRYFDTHAEAWAFVRARMDSAARIMAFKKQTKEKNK